ncbi:MAG: HAMP domain-containing histidine kinase, partial [Oxalobacteraceae bacterium]
MNLTAALDVREISTLDRPHDRIRDASHTFQSTIAKSKYGEEGAFEKSIRIKNTLDKFEQRSRTKPDWRVCAVLVNCEYQLWRLNADIPLKLNPFLSHWVEAIQRLDSHGTSASGVSHGKDDISRDSINMARVLWIKTLLNGNDMTRYLAGKSIVPVLEITDTTNRISHDNLDERIALPKNRDELFVLSTTINGLLDRVENAVIREKRFASDASHELRTPLAVIKGTLEVLIRKPRDTQEYEKQISYCVSEVDRLSNLVDQLLLLARVESQKSEIKSQEVALDEVILESMRRFSSEISNARLKIEFAFEKRYTIVSDAWLVAIVIENL